MQVTLFLTHNCNLRCKYCFNGESVNKEMSMEVAEKAVDFLYKKLSPLYELTFFGGEPLLKFDLIKHIIEYANSTYPDKIQYTYFMLNTNGTILNYEIKEFVLKNKFLVLLSVDGGKRVHDLNRITSANQGSYDLIMKNVEFWKTLSQNNRLLLQMTITPETAGQLFEGVMSLKDIPFKTVIFYFDFDNKWEQEHINIFSLELTKLSEKYEKILLDNECFSLPVFDEFIRFGALKNQKIRCVAGESLYSVGIDGDIYPCQRFVKDGSDKQWVVGNVYHGFNKRLGEYLEAKNAVPDKCNECGHIRRCKQKCTAINYINNGDINMDTPLRCMVEQSYIQNADRIAASLIKNNKERFSEIMKTRFFHEHK